MNYSLSLNSSSQVVAIDNVIKYRFIQIPTQSINLTFHSTNFPFYVFESLNIRVHPNSSPAKPSDGLVRNFSLKQAGDKAKFVRILVTRFNISELARLGVFGAVALKSIID